AFEGRAEVGDRERSARWYHALARDPLEPRGGRGRVARARERPPPSASVVDEERIVAAQHGERARGETGREPRNALRAELGREAGDHAAREGEGRLPLARGCRVDERGDRAQRIDGAGLHAELRDGPAAEHRRGRRRIGDFEGNRARLARERRKELVRRATERE